MARRHPPSSHIQRHCARLSRRLPLSLPTSNNISSCIHFLLLLLLGSFKLISDLPSCKPPIPGTSGGRIGAVALSSARETGLFISTHREVFHVWNVERTAEPLLSKRATRLTLSSAAWSSERDIFALGDTDGRIRVKMFFRFFDGDSLTCCFSFFLLPIASRHEGDQF